MVWDLGLGPSWFVRAFVQAPGCPEVESFGVTFMIELESLILAQNERWRQA